MTKPPQDNLYLITLTSAAGSFHVYFRSHSQSVPGVIRAFKQLRTWRSGRALAKLRGQRGVHVCSADFIGKLCN